MKPVTPQRTRIQHPADPLDAVGAPARSNAPLTPALPAPSVAADAHAPNARTAAVWRDFGPESGTTAPPPAPASANTSAPTSAVSWLEVQRRGTAPTVHDTAHEVLRILAERGVTLQQVSQPESEAAQLAHQEVLASIDASALRGNTHSLLTALRLAHALQVVPAAHDQGAEFLAEARDRGLVVLNGSNAYPEAWRGPVGILREGHPPIFGTFVPSDRAFSASFEVKTKEGTVKCTLDDLVAFAISPQVLFRSGG